jgi:hypothetical protein
VKPAAVPEIGWIDVETTDAGAQAAWFAGRARFTPFQWHYDAFDLPAGATRVLTNAFNPNQGYVRMVALPKVAKVREKFAALLKAESPLERAGDAPR